MVYHLGWSDITGWLPPFPFPGCVLCFWNEQTKKETISPVLHFSANLVSWMDLLRHQEGTGPQRQELEGKQVGKQGCSLRGILPLQQLCQHIKQHPWIIPTSEGIFTSLNPFIYARRVWMPLVMHPMCLSPELCAQGALLLSGSSLIYSIPGDV